MMNILQETALQWVGQGIGVIPIQYRRKEPDAIGLKRATGSTLWEPFQKTLPSKEQIICMFPCSLRNLAVVTGWGGLVVLDFDDRSTFFQWYAQYPLETYMIMTARGVHVYLIASSPTAGRKGKGLDIKAAGGYVLAPPSIHPSGAEYTVLWDLPILRVQSIESYLPAELFPMEPIRPLVQVQAAPAAADPWDVINQAGSIQPGRDLISTIRAKINLLDYLPGAKQSPGDGRWWVVCCPFHDDHNPSMWIDTKRSICGCHAGCNNGRPLDVINLWAALRGIDNQAAIFELARLL